MDSEQIWQTALDELELQLTQATFNTWLSRARLVDVVGDEFVIAAHNQYAQDWLESRLINRIKRTLAGVAGRDVGVRFVVDAATASTPPERESSSPPASEPAASTPEMPDLKAVGYFPVSRYECTFWAPLLGRVAWRVWEIVRGTDIRKDKSDWTPEKRWSAPAMARLVPCGPQAVVGVNRGDDHKAGALERLVEAGVGQYHRQGGVRDPRMMYVVSVLVRLPLLSPVQVIELTDTLRMQHDRWLEEYGFDPREWFVDSDSGNACDI